MEAALVVSGFVAGEHGVFPAKHVGYISLAVLYLLVFDLALKVLHDGIRTSLRSMRTLLDCAIVAVALLLTYAGNCGAGLESWLPPGVSPVSVVTCARLLRLLSLLSILGTAYYAKDEKEADDTDESEESKEEERRARGLLSIPSLTTWEVGLDTYA